MTTLTRRELGRLAALLGVLGSAGGLAACGSGSSGGAGGGGAGAGGSATPRTGEVAMSPVTRAVAPQSSRAPAVAAVTGFTERIAARMLAAETGNLVVSPWSIATALGMTANGARGATQREMLEVLGGLTMDDLDAGLALLADLIASRSGPRVRADRTTAQVLVATANSLWGQRGMVWQQPFLDALARWFGAGMRLVDYAADPEAARRAINAWTSAATRERIPELIVPGVLGAATRLVLVNAVSLKAPWEHPFPRELTAPGDFRAPTGTRSVPMMTLAGARLGAARGAGWVAVSLPYAGRELAMTLVRLDSPDPQAAAAWLAGGGITTALAALRPVDGASVVMPRWTYRTQAKLKPLLTAAGMPLAFSGGDFSGMTAQADLVVDDVVHEAFIAVDEDGTEASAATAVVMREVSAPLDTVRLVLDQPFVVVLHDVESRLPLFVGRVAEPSR